MRGIEGAGRPAAIRYGCFLPELTRMSDANVHTTPMRAYGRHCLGMQAILPEQAAGGLTKIVGVGLEQEPLRRRIVDDGVDAVLLGVGDRSLLAREAQADLAARVATAGPSHQRIGLARFGGHEIEHPLVGERLAGLHGIFRTLEDTGLHALSLSFGTTTESRPLATGRDRKSTRLNSSHVKISYAV